MPVLVSPRRRRRNRRRAAQRRFLAGVALFVLVAAVLIAVFSQPRRRWLRSAVAVPNPAVVAQDPHDDTPATPDERPVYPYSIIAGGAHSLAELKHAIDADPVVRTHFANFDLSKTRVVTLDAPRVAHVSYRVGQRVFWTRKTVVLGRGERVLSDGQHVARTRCGNQVASLPGVVAADEPAPSVLDTPLPPIRRGLVAVGLPPVPGSGTPGGPTASYPSGGTTTSAPTGSIPGGWIGAPSGGLPTATTATNPSIQPSAGDTPTGTPTGAHVDPPPVTPPGSPNLPSNPLPPSDVPPSLHTPPPGFTPPGFTPPGEPPGNEPPGSTPPPDGPPHGDTPPSNPPGDPVPVPEPSLMVLVGGSACAWLVRRRRALSR